MKRGLIVTEYKSGDDNRSYTRIRYNNCNDSHEYREYDGIHDQYMNSCLNLSVSVPTKYYDRMVSLTRSRD